MNRLVHCDGTETRRDTVGRRLIVPYRIARARSKRWEIADAIYEATEVDDAGEIVYRETYWEVPRLGWWADWRGRYHRMEPEPGVYYCPE